MVNLVFWRLVGLTDNWTQSVETSKPLMNTLRMGLSDWENGLIMLAYATEQLHDFYTSILSK
jgi:hypothetical protein